MSDVLPPRLETARRALVEQLLAFAGSHPEEWFHALRARLEKELSSAGAEALSRMTERLLTTGADFTYYPSDPLARTLQFAIAEFAVTPESTLFGVEHLEGLRGRPALFLSNHLSYSDANLFGLLLARAGCGAVTERLTVIAGPKVYSDPVRRFSSLCFGTIKTPQSSARSTDEAVMSARDVARLARETIAIARERQQKGDSLLVFIEGTRSRTGSMQRGLPAVTRYFDPPGPPIVPMAITGSERFLPVDDERLHTATVQVRLGPPGDPALLLAEAGGNRRLVIDAVGVAIARLLPEAYQGTYGEASPDLDDARRLSDTVFGAG